EILVALVLGRRRRPHVRARRLPLAKRRHRHLGDDPEFVLELDARFEVALVLRLANLRPRRTTILELLLELLASPAHRSTSQFPVTVLFVAISIGFSVISTTSASLPCDMSLESPSSVQPESFAV